MNQEKTAGMEIAQVKRHRKKPRVELSLSRVKSILRKAKVKVVNKHAYSIYSCGHVYDVKDDPGLVKYFENEKRGLRCCPICYENANSSKQALITKYKRCGCGAEHVSKRVQPSQCCASCASSRRAVKGEIPESQKRMNGHKLDITRCFCIHRDECLITYKDYDVVPCKGCMRFKEGPWMEDKVY